MMWLFVLLLGGCHLFVGIINILIGTFDSNPPKNINELIILDMTVAIWAIILLIKET